MTEPITDEELATLTPSDADPWTARMLGAHYTQRVADKITSQASKIESLKELASRQGIVIKSLEGKWLPIESAPKGYPSLEEPSEWFLAKSSKQYRGPRSSNVYVIQRVFGVGFGPWAGCGDEYYVEDFFCEWMPLPTPPKGE